MERKRPPKIFQLKAVCITLPFVLCIKTPGPPRRARGLPSFIYMISVLPMNVSFYYSAWHRVQQVNPVARRLLLYATSCSRTSSVLAPDTSLAKSRSSQSDCTAGEGPKLALTRKMTKDKTHIAEAGISPFFDRLQSNRPADSYLSLPTPRMAKY